MTIKLNPVWFGACNQEESAFPLQSIGTNKTVSKLENSGVAHKTANGEELACFGGENLVEKQKKKNITNKNQTSSSCHTRASFFKDDVFIN